CGTGVPWVQFYLGGSRIGTVGADWHLKLWDSATGKDATAPSGGPIGVSPDGTVLATLASETHVRLWQLATRQERASFTGHTRRVTTLAFASDGQTAATADDTGLIYVWDTATGKQRQALRGHTGPLHGGIRLVAGGKVLASYEPNKPVKVWDVPGE